MQETDFLLARLNTSGSIGTSSIVYHNVVLCQHQKNKHMSLVLWKPVFGVSDQDRHKPCCTTPKRLETWKFVFRKWRDCAVRVAKTKALIFVFTYAKHRVWGIFHDTAHMLLVETKWFYVDIKYFYGQTPRVIQQILIYYTLKESTVKPSSLAANGGIYKMVSTSSGTVCNSVVFLNEAQNEESVCSVFGCLAVYRHGSR